MPLTCPNLAADRFSLFVVVQLTTVLVQCVVAIIIRYHMVIKQSYSGASYVNTKIRTVRTTLLVCLTDRLLNVTKPCRLSQKTVINT